MKSKRPRPSPVGSPSSGDIHLGYPRQTLKRVEQATGDFHLAGLQKESGRVEQARLSALDGVHSHAVAPLGAICPFDPTWSSAIPKTPAKREREGKGKGSNFVQLGTIVSAVLAALVVSGCGIVDRRMIASAEYEEGRLLERRGARDAAECRPLRRSVVVVGRRGDLRRELTEIPGEC